MAKHVNVARRFSYLLDELRLDRAGLSRALDNAVSERSLYSILNGHRRPSRSLAVLIERTWGYRADYLLNGTGEMWARSEHGAANGRPLTEDEVEVLQMMSRSPDHARTLKRDLDDAVLWTSLWQRTARMLEEVVDGSESSSADYPAGIFANRARVAFNECLDVSDAYGRLAATRYRRRIAHLISSFIVGVVDSPATLVDRGELEELQRLAESVEQDLRASEDGQREQLMKRVTMPSPLAESEVGLTPEEISAHLLAGDIARVLSDHTNYQSAPHGRALPGWPGY